LDVYKEECSVASNLAKWLDRTCNTTSLFGPNIPLSTLFSNTHSLCSSLKARDQVSHTYRATRKFVVFYVCSKFYVFREDVKEYKYKISSLCSSS
jgi:hypothetical protein